MGEPQRLFSDKPGYEEDFYAWALENAVLLRAARLSEIDAEHIAEELEDMGKSERRALRSHLHNLLLHLLKWQFQPAHRGVSWKLSIRNARHRIGIIVQDSPSLGPQIQGLIMEEYPPARLDAIDETGLPKASFPDTCPYRDDQVIDQAFLPTAT
jgi:ribosomal protein L29